MNTRLQTRALRREYPGVVALAGLDLDVAAGEVVGLLGPNGAGKTTALRMMAGVLQPTAGTATVCGYDTVREPMQVKAALGFLSGDTRLYRRLTPRELLRYFGRLHSMLPHACEARSNRLIEQLGMAEFADRRCGGLSAGQQQKANIARTLLHDPPVLVFDEPTNALDIITGRFILETIRAAREMGRAILFSTHNMGEAEYLCDRLVLLHRGQVIARGTLDNILTRTGRDNLTDAFLAMVEEQA